MAIIARLEDQTVQGQKVRLEWGFYDADDPEKTVFYREAMSVAYSEDLIKLVTDDLMAIGKRVAQARLISKSLSANVPVGTELQVG